jgi:hypothetical protein
MWLVNRLEVAWDSDFYCLTLAFTQVKKEDNYHLILFILVGVPTIVHTYKN